MKSVAQISAQIADIDKALGDLAPLVERHALASLGTPMMSSVILSQHDADYRQSIEIIGDKQRQRTRLTHALAEAERLADGDI